MELLLESIRVAAAPDATDEHRAAGASACRTLLAAFEVKPAALPTGETIVQAVTMLRQVPPEHLLDFAIARLRALTDAKGIVTEAAPRPLAFQFVPIAGAAK